MKHILKIFFSLLIAFSFVACSTGAKDKKADLNGMKAKLEKLKKEKNKLETDIRTLEEDIAKADPQGAQLAKKLVSVDTLRIQDFAHYIELQGKIDADNIAYVGPSGQGGLVKAVYVQLGSRVNKGQLILKLDDALSRQGVIAAQQQIGGIKAQLAQAQSIYQRQQNLWKENIGTEIQVINAKTAVETLESQLRGAQAQVGQAQEMANLSNVYAQISGVVDEMNVRPGEFFSPQTAAQPGMGIRIVNNSSLKIVTAVPDNYIGRVNKGDKILITVADSDKPAIEARITTVGASVDAKTRSFTTEAKLPADPSLKPNQTAVIKILDYEAKGVVVVPVNIVQTDDKGKYVFVMEKEGDKMVARKKMVLVGQVYDSKIEIKSGLTGGEKIITQGYQTVYDGQAVITN